MNVQITLVLISCLLILILGLLIWVVKLSMEKRTVINEQLVENNKSLKNNSKIGRPKYANSKLEETEKEQFLKVIILHLEMHKSYRQANLSISQFAKQVKMPKNYLSQIINEKMNCSFIDFINRYRVNEAKEKLRAPEFQKLSIMEIGRSVGFKAKSTYYVAFKKYTNSSPGDFRKYSIP